MERGVHEFAIQFVGEPERDFLCFILEVRDFRPLSNRSHHERFRLAGFRVFSVVKFAFRFGHIASSDDASDFAIRPE